MVLKMEMTLVTPNEYAPLCLQCGINEQHYTLSMNNTYFIGYCPDCWQAGKSILSNDDMAVLQDIANGKRYDLLEDKRGIVHPLSLAGYLQLERDKSQLNGHAYVLTEKGKYVIEEG